MKRPPIAGILTSVTLTMLLYACGTTPQGVPQAPQEARPSAVTRPTQGPPASTEAEVHWLTAEEALSQWVGTPTPLQLSGAVPAWAEAILNGQRRIQDGALTPGAPVTVRSTVKFAWLTTSTAADDARATRNVRSDLTLLGDAALIPLHLKDGSVGGLLRLSLVAGATSSTSFVLFETPVASVMTAATAREAAGAPPATPVVALALNGRGEYSPFDFSWAVQAAGQGTTVRTITQGLPDLVTPEGRVIDTGARDVRVQPTAALALPDAKARQVSQHYPAYVRPTTDKAAQ